MPAITTTDTRPAEEIRRAMLNEMWRGLSRRQGWARRDSAAGFEWGAEYTPTRALLIPRVTTPGIGGLRPVRDWLVCVPPAPYTGDPYESVSEAVRSAESLPRLVRPHRTPTHFDGNNEPCWCAEPAAVTS
ncbi:hypothetical protein KBX50_08365 [Micromonospora sp. C51]|uniref:hypothetical protein n=1 Tax=Micromonospora sp. C51 TaxID=2824879 RepID=UPI001B36DFA2|nr:hypothetical protein [Micromonospora sp. C51]MBQ1048477.1 hypothetical protein [Micromonospora sp. C51]